MSLAGAGTICAFTAGLLCCNRKLALEGVVLAETKSGSLPIRLLVSVSTILSKQKYEASGLPATWNSSCAALSVTFIIVKLEVDFVTAELLTGRENFLLPCVANAPDDPPNLI